MDILQLVFYTRVRLFQVSFITILLLFLLTKTNII